MPIIIDGSGPISGISLINASVSSTELGYLDGVTSPIQNQIANAISYASSASANALAHATTGGKILQVVRATDGTSRTTTSTSFTDVTGVTVTISPTLNTSAVIVLASILLDNQSSTTGDMESITRLTTSGGTALSGAEQAYFRIMLYSSSGSRILTTPTQLIGYATPATTSATTYKLQHRSTNANVTAGVRGDFITSQIFAFEVGA